MYKDILFKVLIRNKRSLKLQQLFLKADSRQYSLNEDIINLERDRRRRQDHELNLSVRCDRTTRKVERNNET